MKRRDEPQPLPFSRKAQFAYLIKEQPSLLFFANMTTALFFVPLLFVVSWLIVSYTAAAQDESITGMKCFLSLLYPGLCFFPATLIAGFGMSCMTSLVKKLVFDVTATYGDYWALGKANCRQFLIVYGLLGFLLSLVTINFAAYYYIEMEALFKLASLVVSVALTGVLLVILPYVNFQITLFDNTLPLVFLNGLAFTFRRPLLNLLNLLIQYGAIALFFFLPGFFRAIPVMLLATYGIALEADASYLICLDTFERKLPEEQTREFYHKGLEED